MRIRDAVNALMIGAALCLITTAADAKPKAKGATFRDCTDVCPEMVTVKPGDFMMGSPASEVGRYDNEGPVHPVSIKHSFAVGKYDITRDQYAEFVAETQRADPADCWTFTEGGSLVQTAGLNWHNPGFAQTGRDPVVCVGWDDAKAYVAWLSAKTGHAYQLLSEAEFEYAARAGVTKSRYGSDVEAQMCADMNFGELDYSAKHSGDTDVTKACHDGYAYTSPVGSFPPNAFGLYDMIGDVLIWTEDCWNASYKDAPADGSPLVAASCATHAWRGGAWADSARYMRAAYRNGPSDATFRGTHIGFRVARAL